MASTPDWCSAAKPAGLAAGPEAATRFPIALAVFRRTKFGLPLRAHVLVVEIQKLYPRADMMVGLRVSLLTIAAFFLFPDIVAAQNDTVRGNVALRQGWSADTIDRWHFISQGTTLFPYEWFLALQRLPDQELIRSPGNMQRLGFLNEPADQNNNPDGLPVGLYKLAVDFDYRKYACWKGNWLGLGCSGCHTGQVNYHGQQIRIEGGPAHIDIQAFVGQIKSSFGATMQDQQALANFVARVTARVKAPPADVQKGLACYVKFATDEAKFYSKVDPGPLPGFGRLDAHGQGLNQLLAMPLDEVKNYAPPTAPVRYPALWDTPRFNYVLYNGSIRQPLARNVIEALGVLAPIQYETMLGADVVHAIAMDNVIWGQRMLMNLQSPAWPEAILGRLDLKKVARGRQLYVSECADCHDTRPAGMRPQRGACNEVRISMVDLDKIGTDPEQATTFNKRRLSLANIQGPADIANYEAAEIATQKIVEQWIKRSPENAAFADMVNCGRPNRFQAPLSYRARPLNGIWAMSPYLHNGSVPSLNDLLLPTNQRPKTFYVGDWEFDPEIVGFETRGNFPGAFAFDTSKRGNSNAGHEFGTDLSEEDRKALLEYLKTL
jgi:hypothetical protein